MELDFLHTGQLRKVKDEDSERQLLKENLNDANYLLPDIELRFLVFMSLCSMFILIYRFEFCGLF